MGYLVGTDEAGYGPNLGPLVVSATVWCVDSLDNLDLYDRLRGIVSQPTEEVGSDRDVLIVGDSKALYRPGKGLAELEHGVLTFLHALGRQPESWRSIWAALVADQFDDRFELPWYRDYDLGPSCGFAQGLGCRQGGRNCVSGCERVGCAPIHIESRAVFPSRFNRLVDDLGNKATVLSHTTLELVRSVLQNLPSDEPVYVLCDKHGGRNKYGPLLHETFPETLAVVCCEGRGESVYQLGSEANRRVFTFRANGENFLPSALASMVSKYLRELAMRAFNEYWLGRVSDLRPTAGYPVDARRFKKQIEGAQQELGIADQILWRSR